MSSGGKEGTCDVKQAGRDPEKEMAQRNCPNRRLHKGKAGPWECGWAYLLPLESMLPN